MVYLSFFLKFKNQLRRTQSDIVRQVDDFLARSITDAGGKITGSRLVISAVFNEDVIGFWLDIYVLIENLIKLVNSYKELYGYSLVISYDVLENNDLLCRFLANSDGGVFMDSKSVKRFIAYAAFEKPSEWLKDRKFRKYRSGRFYKIKEIKKFKPNLVIDHDIQNEIADFLKNELPSKNVLVTGKDYLNVRQGVYGYLKSINGEFPPLVFCFGSIGLGALVDIWSFNIRVLASGQLADEIDNLHELLFRERLRDEVSDFIIRSAKKFLALIYEFYFSAAAKRKKIPVLVLENIHLAGGFITDILTESLADITGENGHNPCIIGTAEDVMLSNKTDQWKNLFKEVMNTNTPGRSRNVPHLSVELWEFVYAISLFSRYFSPELFHRIFEEDERNPVMISRAFSILHSLGVIDDPRQPWLLARQLEDRAVKILDEKAQRVRIFVCERLISWANKRNITPCYKLLSIISDLNPQGVISDLMLLKSVLTDIINKTVTGLEQAFTGGKLKELIHPDTFDAIYRIFSTSKVLYSGMEGDIDKTFEYITSKEQNRIFSTSPVLNAQIITNLCGYYLGRYKINEAASKAKEVIMLSQRTNSFCLPQVYRLFSLVCLSKKQTSETIEYLNFALTNAEKNCNYFEMAVCAYYSAAAKFLYGDIYSALVLVKKSIKNSLTAGCAEWADRSRFLEGRLNFELGFYKQAQEIFSLIKSDPYGGMPDEKDSLLGAWIFRCSIYNSTAVKYETESSNHDLQLFEIEAAYFSGDYVKAVDLCGNVNIPFTKENFLFTEYPDWSSGYAQCEQLYFTGGEIQDRMLRLFHSLSLSCLPGRNREEINAEIHKLLRDERLCEMDPNDAFYYFAKYLIMEKTGAGFIDMSTAVSIAFKRLQRRAGRIEDVETRAQYLNGSFWNKKLSEAAREFKLI